MEEESNSSSSWSSATNWIVFHGSLKNSISFESPNSLIDGEDVQDSENSTSPNDQVVLIQPSSPDLGPCEIKINLGQRHEIRQVYVRSTARIYEIYYAPEPQSINEYLCTVRCGIAAKEYGTLDASHTEAICAHKEESTEPAEISEEKIKNENINSTDEDGWIEVKVPDSASLTKNIDRNTESSIQDFYEATAEITDASPCISLTIRLLSLQTKGCVHIGEIYIFGEPADPTDSDHQMGPVVNSAGSSLMAMLAPTLLQLSKTGISRIQDRNVSDIREGSNDQDGELKTESLNPNIGKEANMEEVNKESVTRLDHVQGMGQGPENIMKENDRSYGHIEKILDHLVCRVGTIEAFCLRFEENMLKPLGSIEMRLQRLEQQLELLTTKSQSSELKPSTRITAPEFSCNESETNSHYNDGNNDYNCGVLEHASKETPHTGASEFFHNESESNSLFQDGNDDHCAREMESSDMDGKAFSPIFPSLIITAPEFTNDGDGDGDSDSDSDGNCDDASDSANKVCHTNKPSSNIDDALALALAGFLSSTSVQPPKINETLIFKVPDFPNEDDDNNSRGETSPSSTRIPCERAADFSIYFGENNGTHNVKGLDSTLCSSSQDNEMQMKTTLLKDGPIKTLNEILIRQGGLQEKGTEDSCEDNNISRSLTQDKHDKTCRDDDNSWAKVAKEQIEDGNPDLILTGNDIQRQEGITNPTDESGIGIAFIDSQLFAEEKYYNRADTFSKGIVSCTEVTTIDIENERCNKIDSENVFKQNFNCIVDFELPVLDVKFVPKENWKARSPLDDLLGDIQKTEVKDSCSKDNGDDDDDDDDGEQGQLFLGDELKVPKLDGKLLVDVDDLTVKTVVSNMGSDQIQYPGLEYTDTVVLIEGSEQIQDFSRCNNQELPSLI